MLYEDLSIYIFVNQLYLASHYFEYDLSIINCLLFTCIGLSDFNFFILKKTSRSVFLYFYLLNATNFRIISNNGN